VLSADGAKRIDGEERGGAGAAEEVGRALAERLLRQGAGELLAR